MNPEEILKLILAQYQPTYHYQMGKTGHARNFCQKFFKEWKEIEEPDNHDEDCALAQAMRWALGQGQTEEVSE